MGQKHKRYREFWTPFLLRVIRKNPRSTYARVSKVMAQFVLKIEKLSHIMGPAPILELARAYGLRPRLWLLIPTGTSGTNCNHKHGVMLTCRHDVDMFTCGRIVSSLPKRTHVDWNCPISCEKYQKIEWSLKMPLHWLLMGVAGS